MATATLPTRAELSEQLVAERNNNVLLQESLADLERQLLDPGWTRLIATANIEFTPEAMRQMRAVCRLYGIKNPLIKRGLGLRAAYVWGQGVEVIARANGKKGGGEQDVQGVLAEWMADDTTQATYTGAAARDELEKALGTEGEIFTALVTRPLTGWVNIRAISADEIADIITDPEDTATPWYYRRKWNQRTVDLQSGIPTDQQQERLYPALGYRPTGHRPTDIGGVRIAWDSPVLHLAVNRPKGWQRGIPDVYAAIDWAKAFKEFLEDWAKLVRALSRYAWKLTTPGNKAAAARTRIAAPASRTRGGEPNEAGATAIMPSDQNLEAIPKTGATIDSESGRPLATMVAAAVGIPVTMLLADPGQTGARATAETLDWPTETEMGQRQSVWAANDRRIFSYVITESVRAPKGKLKGTIATDENGRQVVTLDGDTPTTIDISWPSLHKVDPDVLIDAIVKADSTGTIRPEEVLRLLLTALGVQQVDELVEAMVDDEGNFIWPTRQAAGPGSAAADAARAGRDPANVDGGPMADGEEDPPEDDPEEDPPSGASADGD
jgi:hypothetical protein